MHPFYLLPDARLLLLLPFIVALERDARQETRNALLNLDPIPHQLRQLLRPSLALRDKLHPRRSRIPAPATAAAAIVPRGGLEDKRGAEVVLRRDAHLAIIVKRELDAEDRRERLAELGRLGFEHLPQAQHALLLLPQLVLQLRLFLAHRRPACARHELHGGGWHRASRRRGRWWRMMMLRARRGVVGALRSPL
jgi:hypothetical protein